MKRKKTSPDFESVRREIARRLQTGLPLAGMIAATGLLCGCQERAGRVPAGSMPRDPALYEQQTEQPKPKTPPQPKKNDRNETENDVPMGDVEPPPSNQTNETCDPAGTMGRYPGKKQDK